MVNKNVLPFQDNSLPGCNIVNEDGRAMTECRDYCMEDGCNKGARERESVMLMLLVLPFVALAC